MNEIYVITTLQTTTIAPQQKYIKIITRNVNYPDTVKYN